MSASQGTVLLDSELEARGDLYEVVDMALRYSTGGGIDGFELVLKKYMGDEALGVLDKSDIPEDGIDNYILWRFELTKKQKKMTLDFLVGTDGFITDVAVVRNNCLYGKEYSTFFDIITAVDCVEEMPESLQTMAVLT